METSEPEPWEGEGWGSLSSEKFGEGEKDGQPTLTV